MEININKVDWIFFLLCFLVSILAEEAFFRGQIGISYLAFIMTFYSLFFWKFRTFSFSHQRIGYLILISIWILAASYYLYDTKLFAVLNFLVIPALVIIHIALVTSPKKLQWNQLFFIPYIVVRLFRSIRYNFEFTKYLSKMIKLGKSENQNVILKKILIGIVISIPVLFVVLQLLISADTQFERVLSNIPKLLSFNPENIIRLLIIFAFTFGFFGYMQVLLQKNTQTNHIERTYKIISIDGIVTLTVLLLLDLVYILFVVIQFKYFFSGTLQEGYTYAEYARRGFFELLFVSMINLTVTVFVIQFTTKVIGLIKKIINLAMTILVLSSGIILISASMRMTMYEDAYGFTFTRVLAHWFMIFLMIILAYTLVKIWLNKLSLFHFYFIASLSFYVGINVINIDKVVVDRNIARFEQTGKIDLTYLNNLSATGTLGLLELYEKNPNIHGLRELLKNTKADRAPIKSEQWQTHNLTRDRVHEKLNELN